MFNPNPLYLSDGYKPGHKAMLAPGTTRLYGTWIPRSLKHAPPGVRKIVSFGQQLTWKHIHDAFEEHFFKRPIEEARQFSRDMTDYIGAEYSGAHFDWLHALGYLPVRVKSLPEGIETDPNLPHMTWVNTHDDFAWLTLYLETIVSNLAWKAPTAAGIAMLYKRQCTEWVMKTDPANAFLIPYLCHDFSARGLSGTYDNVAVGLGHATCFRGSDSLVTIPAARYYYGEKDVCINSVNASEHSVSTTKIFTVGEKQMLSDWMKIFPKGILSVVADTFDLWKLITEYLPALKDEIMARDGKIVIRPDSGNPSDIICGMNGYTPEDWDGKSIIPERKGVIELLWDIFGGTVNEQGYKVLDPHIGAIYGDSITTDRQLEIYQRLAAKGFAATNIVLGIGSFTYTLKTRDTFGYAAKGAWFQTLIDGVTEFYDIYKDPVTDDGTKKSLRGRIAVLEGADGLYAKQQCTAEEENTGLLKVLYEDGIFYNTTTLTAVRELMNNVITELV